MTMKENYNRDGYAVIRSGVSEHIDSIWTESELMAVYGGGVDRYVGFLSGHAKGIGIQEMFLNANVGRAIYDLGLNSPFLISQPVLHVMSPDLRIPNGYYGTAAHQDWSSTQGSLDCVTVWIALTDIGVGNFPLEVMPGSHKQGLRDGKLNGSVLEIECDDKDFIPLECKAGDVVIMSGFLIHRTGKGDGFRIAVSQRFDNADEPTFIERGYPCAQKRVVDREIHWKPTVAQVRNCYVD